MEIESSSNHFKLHSELELHEFQDKLVIRAVDSPDQGFAISRVDGNIDELRSDTCTGNPSKISTIYGVAGTIRLLAGTYILAVTSRREVGTYLGFPIYQVMSMKFLSCGQGSRPLNSEEKRDEAYYLNLLKMVESTPGLYYSYETDITVNLQRRFKLADGWMRKPIWKQADPQYVWNKYIIEELIENKLDGFIMPLLQGNILCISIRIFQTGKLKLKRVPATITLISRRSTRRLGTRMWRRGANLQGDAANFIETEQLMEFDGFISSFLQVRGSIPLIWEQIVDLSYKPRLNIIHHEETAKVVERHFHDLLQRYGETVAVDLTDKHGDEGELSMAFAAEMEKLPDVRYVSFDFHQKCGNGNFDNIQLLYDEISEDFEEQGYFLLGPKGEILAEQEGVIRSNCIDCLDRTNVTQSFLARKSLNTQLQRVGAFSSIDCISMFEEDFETFKTLWVEQGDEISLEYAGSHALKRDLVRFGKQTMAGRIKDGLSALSRYYYNNFQDGLRQDAIDLISGHYTVKYGPPPFVPNRNEALSYLPVASALLIGGLTVTSITLNRAGQNAQSFISSLVCASATAGVMALVKSNGRQICSKPRLCGLL
ncbi:hypothetical protein DCAR_0830432 [Daucus carota subsp. sativus]|uniref:SAC domain-containing protein n=1 Tax=Daucus carota subsp. sativus TaxID=79200 RepID=A0AAF1B992_DAUCS|nr:hypothetical protein DCAR_0830432 [Daucus carota subsp. sativus]